VEPVALRPVVLRNRPGVGPGAEEELQEPIGTRRADFVVEGKVLVELKAIIELEDVHLAQVLNYLKAYKLEVGLLINFGSKSLTFKRLVL